MSAEFRTPASVEEAEAALAEGVCYFDAFRRFDGGHIKAPDIRPLGEVAVAYGLDSLGVPVDWKWWRTPTSIVEADLAFEAGVCEQDLSGWKNISNPGDGFNRPSEDSDDLASYRVPGRWTAGSQPSVKQIPTTLDLPEGAVLTTYGELEEGDRYVYDGFTRSPRVASPRSGHIREALVVKLPPLPVTVEVDVELLERHIAALRRYKVYEYDYADLTALQALIEKARAED